MKYIKFQSTEVYRTAEMEKSPVPMGDKVVQVSTGVVKKAIEQPTTYILPESEIKSLIVKRGKCYINNVEVPQKEFEKVLQYISIDNNILQ